jgi:hypothetical protein
MTVNSAPWEALRRISKHVDKLEPIDRELLRPALAALDGAQMMALPTLIISRIRDIDARLPRQPQ